MKLRRLILILCLCAALTVQLAFPAAADGATDIIRELITYYTHHQENAQTDILRLLEQLRQLDPEQAEDWEQIMASWEKACSELTLNPDVLPDGLPENDSLCIVVMGFALYPNGSMRPELLGRLEVALQSAGKYPNAFILCTGGGTASANYGVTEAGQMAQWLTEQGIEQERIIIENRSYSTELNAQYSMEILQRDYPQVTSLALISSDYHLRRCQWLFESAIVLAGLETQCRVISNAAFAAGYEGESGFAAEAESMGNLFGLSLRYTAAPELSDLTGITVSGAQNYTQGQSLDLQITAEYDSGFTRDVSGLAVITGYEPDSPRDQELQITYTENGVTAAAAFAVSVAPPPTETPAEVIVTEAAETEPDPTESPAIVPEEPESEGISLQWPVWCAIALAAAALLLFKTGKTKGKYQK